MIGAVLAAALAATAQQDHHRDQATSARPVAMAALPTARATLDDSLVDYPEARFRSVRFTDDHQGQSGFCGEMNTKNRMGGFTGWKRFFLLISDDKTLNALYDKLTVEGEQTKLDKFLGTYSPDADPNRDSSGKVIDRACGQAEPMTDSHDYSPDLTYSSK